MTYRTNEAFECYRSFLALKRHFTSNYDFFKYNGKVNVSIHSFEKRNDKWHFAKLSKIPHWKELMLANISHDPNMWIGKLLEPLAEERYKTVAKRRGALLYYYGEELKKTETKLNDLLTPIGGQHPPLLERFLREDVSIETMVILDQLVGYKSKWDKHIADPVVWPNKSTAIKKYQPFLHFDKDKFKKKTLDIFSKMD